MSTRFRSTRSPSGGTVTFTEALFQGLAKDGGLFEPVTVPQLPAGWSAETTFPELAHAVLANWLGDLELGEGTFEALVHGAFDFPVPLTELPDDRWLLELHHGPTLAFKDFGARFMARVMDALLERAGRRLTIVVATSGDTGSAVADGFAGLPNTDVVLLYPEGRVSPLQELQLTVERPGVRALKVAGTFDDCQRMAKAVLADAQVQARGVSSANSINIGRLLPQQLYYLWAVRLLEDRTGEAVRPLFSVPSGNLGNLTAGVYATLSGMPAGGFIAAHNDNDWFPRWLAGEARTGEFPATRQTISNAMDVGAPSNFERLHALGDRLDGLVSGYGIGEEATLSRIRRSAAEDGIIACPHTAVGLEAVELQRANGPAVPTVILATAHAAKFPEVVGRAVPDVDLNVPALSGLSNAATAVTGIEASDAALKDYLLG